jgi:hypothetical protein
VLVAQFSSSSNPSLDEAAYRVDDNDGILSCDCRGFLFRQSCNHVAAVERYRKWRVNIPADRVLPPPAVWLEREIEVPTQIEDDPH